MEKYKNIIFEALAIDDKASASASLSSVSKSFRISELYLKNALVSLASIKEHNKDTCVALVINIDLDENWKDKFQKFGIKIFYCPFEAFIVPKSMVYSLSFYKLCAFDYLISNTDFQRYCFVDCDTFSIGSYDALWIECDDALNIVANESSVSSPKRVELREVYRNIYSIDKLLTHYCSSFIAGKKEDLLDVIKRCRIVYKNLFVDNSIDSKIGDEIIWSLALADYNRYIHSPKPYCLLSFISAFNYWIDKEYWNDKDVFMWHLPGDKRYSLIWAYDYLIKNGYLPSKEKMASASRFRNVKTKFSILAIQAILKDKTALKRNFYKLFK